MLSIRGISKRFGNLQALADVSLDFVAGEIHCILGENGAGKSTLMQIVDGVSRADAGEVCIDGRPLQIDSPRAASAAGIGMVHQHFTLVDAMTVAENLALSVPGRKGPGTRRWGLKSWRLDRTAIAAHAAAFAARVGLAIPPADQCVRELSVGTRQRLEILKALLAAGKVLILDEPTAVLTPSEVEQLFGLLRALRAQQRLIIFITHKLREVKEVGDRVTIMRRGRVVATHQVAAVSEAALVEAMIGEALPATETSANVATTTDIAVTLEHVSTAGAQGAPALVDVNLQVRAGEIVGIAGVDGNGQRELFEVLAGLQAPSTGMVRVGELQASDRQPLTPRTAHAAGVASIPPDRQRDGLALPMSVTENFLLSSTVLQRFTRRGLLDYVAARQFAAQAANQFAIRLSSLDQPARALSGGNQQRVIVARELSQQPRLLLAVNPTRGLDVQATQTVATAIRAAAAAGGAVILISTDLDELLDLSHRIAVLFRGRLSPPIEPPFDTTYLGQRMATP